MSGAAVIGGGPAGLMAAQALASAGHPVQLFEAKPSLGRKFLMAGKSGLNLTRRQEVGRFLAAYAEAAPWLAPSLADFGPEAVERWAEGLGQPVFAGSTGRVFPRAMKASPLLRAWLAQLEASGVTFHRRHRWTGWQEGALRFATPDGTRQVTAGATVLALGGASWARLGSTGEWAPLLAERGVELAPFSPANAAVAVRWSDHMRPVLGRPLKAVGFRAGPYASRGEAILSHRGLEGGGIYAVSRGVREGHAVVVDLLPDLTEEQVLQRIAKARPKASRSNLLRQALRLDAPARALLMECAQPWPDTPAALARQVKSLRLAHDGLRPMDEAISTAGGVMGDALDPDLMLRALPGTFCAGEMLNWEAPTGGYLLTGCFATGLRAGQSAARYLSQQR